jgi:two-component system, sensor histidine kinase and response regulator
VSQIIGVYPADTPKAIPALEIAVKEDNSENTFRLAHKLKSSSANVGALRLSTLFKELEMRGRQNNTDGTDKLFANIKVEFEAVREALEMVAGA